MRRLVPAKIGSVWFALDAEPVAAVAGTCKCVPIPHPSPRVAGVFSWRGRAIAVLDLAPIAGDTTSPLEARPRTLVLESSGCTVAVPVDAVREVQAIDEASVEQQRVTRMQFSAGEVDMLGTPMPLLDVHALVQSILAVEPRDE
jgi:chemotaxis signal transduction protein